MKPLVLGYGRLGKEIVKQTDWDFIDRSTQSFDFSDINTYYKYLCDYDTIVNCIANTSTYSGTEKELIDTNYKAVCSLTNYCNQTDKKIVHISSDYIYAGSTPNATENDVPVHARTWYAYSKLLGDSYVKYFAENYLLIRTSFKEYPFPYERAPINQYGNFDYTDIISFLIIKLINKKANGVYNVGTNVKTVYDLATLSNKNVTPIDGHVIDKNMPLDITMDTEKMNEFINSNTDL